MVFRKIYLLNKHAVRDIVAPDFENINRNFYAGLMISGLRKTFDTVFHDIMYYCSNLIIMVRGPAKLFMKSFLKRRQYPSTGDTYSDIECNKCGVAQGSTFGPILFLLHINGLPNSTICHSHLFSNYTCLVKKTEIRFICNKS